MNMKTTALVAILVVSAVAMIGAGYAAYTGVTTSNDNAIGEQHLYVTNGISTAVINGNIVYETIFDKSGTGEDDSWKYKFIIDKNKDKSVTPDSFNPNEEGVIATESDPQLFNGHAVNITFNGVPGSEENKTKTVVYVKLPAQSGNDFTPTAGDGQGQIHLMVRTSSTNASATAKLTGDVVTGEGGTNTGNWVELNSTVDNNGKYVKILETTTNGDITTSGKFSIQFGAYGTLKSQTEFTPDTLSSLNVTFLVVTGQQNSA